MHDQFRRDAGRTVCQTMIQRFAAPPPVRFQRTANMLTVQVTGVTTRSGPSLAQPPQPLNLAAPSVILPARPATTSPQNRPAGGPQGCAALLADPATNHRAGFVGGPAWDRDRWRFRRRAPPTCSAPAGLAPKLHRAPCWPLAATDRRARPVAAPGAVAASKDS